MATTANTTKETLAPCCGVCGESEATLLKCAGCKVIRYCTKEHQIASWPTHKTACSKIKKSQIALSRVKADLLIEEPNIFDAEHRGHFWGLIETRPYMRSRYAVVEAILKVHTFDAVQLALENLMDMLQLCRGDNMGVRDQVPHLLLRLGRGQECYDFVKWWVTGDPDGRYDWGDMSLPYLDLKGEDMYEGVEWFGEFRFADLSFLVAMTLLKVRLLLSLRRYEGSVVIGDVKVNNKGGGKGKVPVEIVDQIREELLKSSVAGDLKGRRTADLIKDLEKQINTMFDGVNKANQHFWAGLLVNAKKHLEARPSFFSPGSKEDMQLKVQYSYNAWKEDTEALEYVYAIFRMAP